MTLFYTTGTVLIAWTAVFDSFRQQPFPYPRVHLPKFYPLPRDSHDVHTRPLNPHGCADFLVPKPADGSYNPAGYRGFVPITAPVQNSIPECNIFVEGIKIQQVDMFNYLGSMLTDMRRQMWHRDEE